MVLVGSFDAQAVYAFAHTNAFYIFVENKFIFEKKLGFPGLARVKALACEKGEPDVSFCVAPGDTCV